MPSTGYEIAAYRSEFRNQIVGLQEHLWAGGPDLNAAYFAWKYEQNPYLEIPVIQVALCDERVVGMLGAYGAKWLVGKPGQSLPGPCLSDLVIHPDHRNQGLFPRLLTAVLRELRERDYAYVFDLGSRPEVAFALLMMGWRRIGFLQTAYWSPGSPRRVTALRSTLRQIPFLRSTYRRLRSYAFGLRRRMGERPFHALDRTRTSGRDNSPRLSIEDAPRPTSMAELVGRVVDGRVQHVRDEEYLAWRFQNPLCEYRFLFWSEDPVDGYLVLQARRKDRTGAINIVDWEAVDMAARAKLLEAVIGCGSRGPLGIWSGTLQYETKRLLSENGFRFVDETGNLTRDVGHETVLVKPLHSETSSADVIPGRKALLAIENWDLRMMYCDNY
jgi:GNAT superfamily N-acetyltransferase